MSLLTQLMRTCEQLWKNSRLFLVLVMISALFAGTGMAMLGRVWWLDFQDQRLNFHTNRGSTPTRAAEYRRFIDGLPVVDQAAQDPPLAAAVLDNITEARPQAGIGGAPFVWEVPVEGGMTRFVAIAILPRPASSAEQGEGWGEGGAASETRIGPIRSVRPYMLDLASEFHAPLFHVGGSPEALTRVKNGASTINEFYRGWFFYRDPARARPSNVFITVEKMAEAIAHDQFSAGSVSSSKWHFSNVILSDPGPASGESKDLPVADRTIQVAFGAVTVEWRYDPERRAYVRYQNGAPHQDEQGREIVAANVIVQEAPITILDAVGRRKIDLFGEGRATVYRGGEIIEGLWRRPFRNTRTRFFDAQGAEILFSPGTTWVEVVPLP